jgi:hypothetical protein
MDVTDTPWNNNAADEYYFTFRDSTNAHVVRSAPSARTYGGGANLPLFVAQTPTFSGVSSWSSIQGEVYLKNQDPNLVDPLVYTSLLTNATYNLFDCVADSPFTAYEDSEDATQHAKYLAGVPLTQRAWANSWPNKPYASIFADNFLRQTTTACSSANTQALLNSAWAGFASDYAALNATVQGFIKSATALTTPDTTTFDNLMQSCVGRYDCIMHRYLSDTTLNDFMARGTKKAYSSPIDADEDSLHSLCDLGRCLGSPLRRRLLLCSRQKETGQLVSPRQKALPERRAFLFGKARFPNFQLIKNR